jgi:lantibiotic modifying enzyme
MRRSPTHGVPARDALIGDTLASLHAAVTPERRFYPTLSKPVASTLKIDLSRAIKNVELSLGETSAAAQDRARALRAALWREATLETLRAASADRQMVQRILSVREPGELTGFESGLGDPHNEGRTAARLTFGAGTQVYYKPRDATAERAVFALLHWFDRAMSKRPRRLPAMAVTAAHAWIAPVIPTRVTVRGAARAAHQAGELLAILDMLQTIDAHGENLLWCADGIVPVDLETVLQPRMNWTFDNAMEPEDAATVLRVGLLPGGFTLNVPGASGVVHDSEGIGAWLPSRVEECCAGFAGMYRTLVRQSAALLRGSPLRRLRAAPVRVVLRSTRTYGALTRSAWNKATSRRSVESLAGRELRALDPGRWPPAVRKSEARAIARLDVPRFTSVAREAELRDGDGVTFADAIGEDGWTRACRWLTNANERDLEERLAVIRATLQLAVLRRRMQSDACADTARTTRRR